MQFSMVKGRTRKEKFGLKERQRQITIDAHDTRACSGKFLGGGKFFESSKKKVRGAANHDVRLGGRVLNPPLY